MSKTEIPKIKQFLSTIDSQTGYFKVIYYLFQHKGGHINLISASLSMGNQTLYRVFDLLKDHELIKMKVEPGKAGKYRKNYYLSEKGKKVAIKLVELVNEIRNVP